MKRVFSSLAVAVTVASSSFCLPQICPAQGTDAFVTAAASPATDISVIPVPSPVLEAKSAAVDLSRYKTADSLWEYIQEWAAKEPAIDKNLDRSAMMEKINAFIAEERAHLTPACEEFLKRYPQEARRWDVKLVGLSVLQNEEGAANPETEKTLQDIADAADAGDKVKKKARQALLGIHLQKVGDEGLPPTVELEIAAYEKDFPDDPDGAQFVSLRMHYLGESPTPERVAELLTRLAKSPNKATATTAQAQLDLRAAPLDLKFTAVDGREVDLAKMRGKVVLVDFWATWCGPCVQEVPNVVAAYRKYHDRGLEIVGISLDKDKASLEKFIKAKEMTWPQYFDGKFWQNDFARRFGIDSIPAMWLVGADGKVVNFEVREDLEGSIERLLGVKPAAAPAAPAAGMASASTLEPSGAASQP